MAAPNFPRVMPRVFAHEGGYSNDPHDPGGATNYGITAKTLGAYRGTGVATPAQVQALTPAEATAIYRSQYAGAIRFDDLPSGVDYAVLDFAINSGVTRASRALQQAVGATIDGNLGMNTVAACRTMPPGVIVNKLCDDRLAFLQGLSTWKYYGAGWSRRVADVRAYALVLAQQPIVVQPVPVPAPPPPAEPTPLPAPAIPLPSPDNAPTDAAKDVPPPLTQSKTLWGTFTSALSSGGFGYAMSQVFQNPNAVWIVGIAAACLVIGVVAIAIVFRERILKRLELGV